MKNSRKENLKRLGGNSNKIMVFKLLKVKRQNQK